MDIDLVYLWVDGSDPVWRAKKAAFEQGGASVALEAVEEARFVDNDELKYSLRSIEMYAPWIRHIYIVTDNQVPSWLDLTNSRISIVDHTDIMPASALPTFSSPAIEWCVDKIPGLSEHFLLANDDTFVACEVSPDFFFNSKGQPIVRLKKWTSSKRRVSLYLKTVAKAQNLIQRDFGAYIKYIPHHNIDAYRKSDFKACKEHFAEEVEATVHRHLRHEDDLQRVAILYYALANDRGQLKIMGRYNKEMELSQKVKYALRGIYHYDTRCISLGEKKGLQYYINRYNPILFCVNDNEKASAVDRMAAREFLERLYPNKSSFEV